MQHFLCMHVCNISYACMQHFLRNVAYSIKCSVCASYSVQCRTAVLCMKKEKEGKRKVNLSGSKYVSSSHLNKGKYLMPGTKWTLKVRYESEVLNQSSCDNVGDSVDALPPPGRPGCPQAPNLSRNFEKKSLFRLLLLANTFYGCLFKTSNQIENGTVDFITLLVY